MHIYSVWYYNIYIFIDESLLLFTTIQYLSQSQQVQWGTYTNLFERNKFDV